MHSTAAVKAVSTTQAPREFPMFHVLCINQAYGVSEKYQSAH